MVSSRPSGSGSGYPRGGLHGQIVHAIGRQILTGKIRPGDLLPTETELMERMQVGRSSVREAERAGLRVRRYDRARAPDPSTDEQLESVSEEWLRERRLGELGFSQGQFSLESLDALTVFVCEVGGRIQAFASWVPYRGGEAAVPLQIGAERAGRIQ